MRKLPYQSSLQFIQRPQLLWNDIGDRKLWRGIQWIRHGPTVPSRLSWSAYQSNIPKPSSGVRWKHGMRRFSEYGNVASRIMDDDWGSPMIYNFIYNSSITCYGYCISGKEWNVVSSGCSWHIDLYKICLTTSHDYSITMFVENLFDPRLVWWGVLAYFPRKSTNPGESTVDLFIIIIITIIIITIIIIIYGICIYIYKDIYIHI